MIRKLLFGLLAGLLVLSFNTDAKLCAQDDGFVPIFDGKTLRGWKGKKGFWKVVDGAIVGKTTPQKKIGQKYVSGLERRGAARF